LVRGVPAGRCEDRAVPVDPAVARAAARTARYGQQLRNPAAVALRNTLLRLTPSRLALRGMARYADWQPPRD
ncbi:FAD-dependent oxidoreductase, partial [Micromonospora globispora]